MRTIHEYEPVDIKMDGFAEGEKMDPVHSFLMGQMFVIALTGFTPRPDDPPGQPAWPIRRLIAQFLNDAQKAGITIAPAVPESIRAGMER